jgi:membrane protein
MTNKTPKRIFIQLPQWIRPFSRSVVQMLNGKCFTHAAAIAYYAVFSIFPLLLFSISILGFLLESDSSQEQVVSLAGQYLPPGARRLIRENISAIVTARGSLSIFSIASLLWSATFMFDAINDAVNVAWGITEKERFLSSKMKSLLIVLILFLVVLASTLLTTEAILIQHFGDFLLQFPWGEAAWHAGHRVLSAVGWIISWSLVIMAFALTYRFLPRAKVNLRDVWLAAMLAATMWELSKRVFVWYVASFANYGQVYGPISAVLVLLLWTYLSALILIWGAEFAAQNSSSRDQDPPLDV